MARKHLAPYRAQRSARLTGFGLGRVSVLISKPGHQDGQACFRRPKRESNREAAVVDRTHHQAGQDRSQVLPDALLEEILKDLAPNDARTCSAVCKRWKLLSDSETVWKPLCEVLGSNSSWGITVQSQNFQRLWIAGAVEWQAVYTASRAGFELQDNVSRLSGRVRTHRSDDGGALQAHVDIQAGCTCCYMPAKLILNCICGCKLAIPLPEPSSHACTLCFCAISNFRFQALELQAAKRAANLTSRLCRHLLIGQQMHARDSLELALLHRR